MKVKKAQKLRNYLIFIGIAIMLLSYVYEPLLYVGAVIEFSSLIPHFLYNKCPYCGKQLGRNEGNYCQHCGKRID